MFTKLAIAISAALLAAGVGMAAQQPPAHTGHFKPFVSAALPPDPDGTGGMAILSAVVNTNATVTRGAGVTGASHLGTGFYEVDFNRDVTACTYNISIGTISFWTITGTTDVASRAGNANGIFVETRDLTGASADVSFHALVFCAK